MRRLYMLVAIVAAVGITLLSSCSDAAPDEQKSEVIQQGIAFLQNGFDAEEATWNTLFRNGTDALAVAAIAAHDPQAKQVRLVLDRFQAALIEGKPLSGEVRNYVASCVLLAVGRLPAEQQKRYAVLVKKSQDEVMRYQFVENYQWEKSQQRELGPDDWEYGGFGYGSNESPDLSNTGFSLEGLKTTGYDMSNPRIQASLTFLSRLQNNEETNKAKRTAVVVTIDGKKETVNPRVDNDGGATYRPLESKVDGGATKVGDCWVARSYGSMTYQLLKSYVFVGISKSDPRVKAALTWIKRNYTWDENPGMGTEGHFYYLMAGATALKVLEIDKLKDDRGAEHDWKKELQAKLKAMQRLDGSWVNEDAARWGEGEPVLATAFALLALAETK